MLLFALILLFTVLSVLGSVVGTCTQGDDSRFFSSVSYVALTLIILIPYLLRGTQNSFWRRVYAVVGIIAPGVICWFWFPFIVETTLIGHHLCGNEFDHYPDRHLMIERMIPLLHVLSSIFIALSCVVKYWRGFRFSQYL